MTAINLILPKLLARFSKYSTDNPGKGSLMTLIAGVVTLYASYKGFDIGAMGADVCSVVKP